jgi:FkbM family methyltransferase
MTALPWTEDPLITAADGSPLPVRLSLLRRILTYAPYPVRRVAQSATRRLGLGRLPAMRTRYCDGRTFLLPAGDVVYANVFVDGTYEPTESRVVASVLRPGDFAIDVGANHGWYSLLMASVVGPTGRVWAIEPVARTREALATNLSLNSHLRVEVFPMALGESVGKAEIHSFAGLPHAHASTSTLGRTDESTETVEQRTLDDLLDQEESLTPTFVKADVEGAELDVLRGAHRTIRLERPPIWMLEVNRFTSDAFSFRPEELLDYFVLASPHHRAYRIGRGSVEPELHPRSAPHGATWLVVPSCYEERLGPLRSLLGRLPKPAR